MCIMWHNKIGIKTEGSISTWLLARGKEMAMPKPEGCRHNFLLSQESTTILLWTLRILFILLHENYCKKSEIFMPFIDVQ